MTRRPASEPLPGAPDPWAASDMPRYRSRPPYVMSEMIAAEPALAQRLVRRLARSEAVDRLAGLVRDVVNAGRPVVTTGCGTSMHAAMGIAELLNEALEVHGGRGVASVEALETLRRPMRDGLLIGVSHEGGTAATNRALDAAREAGARTALVTVTDRSPGAAVADIVVATEEQDQSWCHTVGYLSPLLVGVALAARVSGTRPDAAAIHALLDVANEPRAAADVAAGLSGVDRLVVVGSAIDHVTARELALKVAEGARLPAEALELEEVHHGHLAAATRWTGLVLVLADRDAGGLVRERATRALDAARALSMPVAAILGERTAGEIPGDGTPAGRIVVPHTDRVRGLAGDLLGSAMALQLLAERLARARGVDPDTLGREDEAQAAAHA
jgi:glucosamine 6-phosphate synthetase-like amidotransferase/phosphosugar isomerase protein